MEPVGSTPVANGKPTSTFDQTSGTTEQPQPFSPQDQISSTSNKEEAEVRGIALGQRPNGIFIIEPNHPRTPESPDVERSTEFFDDKERFDSAVTSSANSVYKREVEEIPYHVFSISKKRQLVYIVSLAGLFSPLSSNIYFPALKEISTVCTFLNP